MSCGIPNGAFLQPQPDNTLSCQSAPNKCVFFFQFTSFFALLNVYDECGMNVSVQCKSSKCLHFLLLKIQGILENVLWNERKSKETTLANLLVKNAHLIMHESLGWAMSLYSMPRKKVEQTVYCRESQSQKRGRLTQSHSHSHFRIFFSRPSSDGCLNLEPIRP